MAQINIRYIVEDVESAINFYTEYLGFHVDIHPAPGFAILTYGDLRLLMNQAGAGVAGQNMPDSTPPKPGGWNRMQLSVNDLHSLYTDLKSKGATFRNEIIEGKGGIQVLLEDPSGNLIELFEPTEKKFYKPKAYHTVTPYLAIQNADRLVDFLKNVFDAVEHRLWRR